MDKYFIVKNGSRLYEDYFKYLKDSKKVNDAFKSLVHKFDIETKEYFPCQNLGIVATKNDREKFGEQLKKDGEFFKVNSKINKEWKDNTYDVKIWNRPRPGMYLERWISGNVRTRFCDR